MTATSKGAMTRLPRLLLPKLLIVALAATGVTLEWPRSLAPLAPAPLDAASLSGQAQVRRDEYGVPHILADTEEAAAFAHGYAVAEDHFEVLARAILHARGEQAHFFGESSLNHDFLVRELRIYDGAEEIFPSLPPLTRALLSAYAEGVNLYLTQNRDRAPAWARPITAVDLLAHCRRVILMDFAMDLGPLWKERSIKNVGIERGSNMWAIGRGRSASGRGLLLANPHLMWEGSFLFHEVQLTVPGQINMSGAALVGFPVIGMGFNEQLGWALTVNEHDSDDVYELSLDPDQPNHYIYDGRSLPLTSRVLTVQVKTPTGVETKTKTVWASHHGPIIRIDGAKAYAFKSSNYDLVDFLTQLNQMAKAKSLAGFRAALNLQQLPLFNIGYTDRDGQTFYQYNARVPIRPEGAYRWSGVVPGNTSKTEWHGIHPLSELPQLLNPGNGYVQNCNDSPWFTNLRHLIDPAGFPSYISRPRLMLRGQVSLQMLEASPRLTLDQVITAKFDNRILMADRMRDDLVAMARGKTIDKLDLTPAADVLAKWDKTANVDSRGGVLFTRWVDKYAAGGKIPFKRDWDPKDPTNTPTGVGDEPRALKALAEAVAEVRHMHTRLDVPWGEVYRVERGSLDRGLGAAPGLYGVFRSVHFRMRPTNAKRYAISGDSYVLAVEFTDVPTAWSVTSYSQSSNPSSPHYTDQTGLYIDGKLKRAWFAEADVQQHTVRAYRPGETPSSQF